MWDVDGNRYLDMRIGDWVMALGHRNETVRDAIVAQLDRASQLGCPEWDLAHRMASLLIDRMPSVERVRFLASGTESNLLALRLARAHTGRTKLAKAQGSYHGIADVLVVGDSSISFDSPGIPAGVTPGVAQDVVEFPFNDPDGAEAVLEREGAELAAVLIEPIMGAAGMVPATTEFLKRLREVTERLGIVLIFDEVVTFPIAYGGAQAHHGVTPDLTVMSKSIGGGLPQAAVGGRAEIMGLLDPYLHNGRAPVLAASTFGGNVTALAAGIAAIEQLTPEMHQRVQAVGERMRRGIDEIGEKYAIPLQPRALATSMACTGRPSASSTIAPECSTTTRNSRTSCSGCSTRVSTNSRLAPCCSARHTGKTRSTSSSPRWSVRFTPSNSSTEPIWRRRWIWN